MFSRQHGKSDMLRILQGMDFGRLEETALKLSNGERVMVSNPTARNNSEKVALAAMMTAMQHSLTGTFAGQLWGDELIYTPPEPHLKSQVFDIIDKFWSYPGEGHMYLYLEQLRKNPITKDLFKGKSTTHHYPWYRRGTKY